MSPRLTVDFLRETSAIDHPLHHNQRPCESGHRAMRKGYNWRALAGVPIKTNLRLDEIYGARTESICGGPFDLLHILAGIMSDHLVISRCNNENQRRVTVNCYHQSWYDLRSYVRPDSTQSSMNGF